MRGVWVYRFALFTFRPIRLLGWFAAMGVGGRFRAGSAVCALIIRETSLGLRCKLMFSKVNFSRGKSAGMFHVSPKSLPYSTRPAQKKGGEPLWLAAFVSVPCSLRPPQWVASLSGVWISAAH
jgi:hypothetical protein